MTIRWPTLLTGLALLAATAFGWAAARRALATYVELQALRLDPSGERGFEHANRRLGPPAPGSARVVLFGDSRVSGWHELPPLPTAEVVNRGRSSDTTAQGLLRLDRDVVALQPGIVVIQTGINDLKNIGLFPERAAEIVQACTSNLEQIVGRLRAARIEVVLLTIFPVGPVPWIRRPFWSDRIPEAIAEVNLRLLALAGHGVTVLDCGAVLADDSRLRQRFADGTLHLSPAGYAALGSCVAPTLRKLVSDHLAAE
jgi:lysophospholipase L1-like esterase